MTELTETEIRKVLTRPLAECGDIIEKVRWPGDTDYQAYMRAVEQGPQVYQQMKEAGECGLPITKAGVEPQTEVEKALKALRASDDDLTGLAESRRQPGESRAASMSRLLEEHPELYSGHKRVKATVLRGHGFGDVAGGGI